MNSVIVHGQQAKSGYSMYNTQYQQLGGAAAKKPAAKKPTSKKPASKKPAAKGVSAKPVVKKPVAGLTKSVEPVAEPTVNEVENVTAPVTVLSSTAPVAKVEEDPFDRVYTVLDELNSKVTPVKCVTSTLEEGIGKLLNESSVVPSLSKLNLEVIGDLCQISPNTDLCKDDRYISGCSLVSTGNDEKQIKCNGYIMGGKTKISATDTLLYNNGNATFEDIKMGVQMENACVVNTDGTMFCTPNTDVKKYGLYTGAKQVIAVPISDKMIDNCSKQENTENAVCKAIINRTTSKCVVGPLDTVNKRSPISCNELFITHGSSANKIYERREGGLSKEICAQTSTGIQCIQSDKYGLYGRNTGLKWEKRNVDVLTGMSLISG